MTDTFLFTFTPVGGFFFGGPESFSDGFFVASERFPQPSTVMGALRAALLTGENLLVQHKRGRFVPKEQREAAFETAGRSKLNHFEETPDFGVIQRVSPAFLIRKSDEGAVEDAFFPAPADVVKKDGEFVLRRYRRKVARVNNCGRSSGVVFLAEHRAKDIEGGAFLGGAEFWRAYLSENAVRGRIIDPDGDAGPFIKQRQVGVGLERRKAEEGRFYVKTDFRLADGWAFAAVVRLSDPDKRFSETIVMGGEQSIFRLKKERIDPADPLFKTHPILAMLTDGAATGKSADAGMRKCVAVSPLLLSADSDILEDAVHIVAGGAANVRMLNSVNLEARDERGKSPFIRNDRKVLKTDAYRMIPAGAVFFTEQARFAFDVDAAPSVIGYNLTATAPTTDQIA